MKIEHLTSMYDFREEIVAFQTDDPIARHFIYQAVGIAQADKKSKNAAKNLAYFESKNLYESQPMRDDSPGAEADNCRLLQDVFFLLHMMSPGNRPEYITIPCDTMNSISTTMNKLLFFHRNELDIKYRVSKRKSVAAYFHHQAEMRNILQSLNGTVDFLRAAYTIGNFIPIPAGCNGPRGFHNKFLEDYWDLTLYYIYQWYQTASDSYLEKIVGKHKVPVYRLWLESFRDWDTFVQKNSMQPFVVGGGVQFSFEPQPLPALEKGFGPPKPLWDGHFGENASVLPQSSEQISAFFSNAAAAINARSHLLIEALQQRHPCGT